MVKLVNRAKMTTSTTGTGTITLAVADIGYQSFADAGVVDGDVVRYVIEDGSNWEIGSGTYTASGTTLSRTVSESSDAGSAIALTGSAKVFIAATADDIVYTQRSETEFTATEGQTTFTTPYDAGLVDVYLNGVKLIDGTDFTATDNANIVLASGAAAGDTVDIVAYGTFELANVYTQAQSDARYLAAYQNGVVTFDGGVYEAYTAVTSSSNATTVDLQDGTNFSHTLTENTTFTFSNPAASGSVSSFTLKIVQDASASGFTVTWPASVDWPAATAPTLTATASAVDYFVFITHDGGTTWYGFTAGQALG
jgi:hypothetical protein